MSVATYAQTNAKLGYVDSNELLEALPDRKKIENELIKFRTSLENELKTMGMELQSKYQDYQNNVNTLSDLVKQTKEKELQDLQQRIQQFEASAQTDIAKKRDELLTPLLDKVRKAINDAANEGSYTYVFDVAAGGLVVYEKGDNLNAKVLAKLGVKK